MAEYNCVEHLAKSYWLLGWQSNLMLMMTGYFDETGDLPDVARKINGMAGFIAPTDEWLRIQGEWLMHISSQKYDDYHDSNIRKDRKEKRRKPLLDILDRYNVLPMAWFVPMDNYRCLSSAEQSQFGDPYYRAYLHCLTMTATFRGFDDQSKDERSTQQVMTVFASRNDSFHDNAKRYFDAWAKKNPLVERLFDEPIFRKAKGFIPLGMADMLCAIIRDEFARQLYTPDSEPAESYRRICKIADAALSSSLKEYLTKSGYQVPITLLPTIRELRWYIQNDPLMI